MFTFYQACTHYDNGLLATPILTLCEPRRRARGTAREAGGWCAGSATCLSERREDLRDDCTRDVVPVIWVRCAPAAGAVKESFLGRPVQAGLLRCADSAATGAAPVVSSAVSEHWQRPVLRFQLVRPGPDAWHGPGPASGDDDRDGHTAQEPAQPARAFCQCHSLAPSCSRSTACLATLYAFVVMVAGSR